MPPNGRRASVRARAQTSAGDIACHATSVRVRVGVGAGVGVRVRVRARV